MDRALDLKPEVTQGCGFKSRLRQEVHDCSPGAAQSAALCSKCVHLDGLNAENTFHSSFHISLLCIIVYVTNKAHPIHPSETRLSRGSSPRTGGFCGAGLYRRSGDRGHTSLSPSLAPSWKSRSFQLNRRTTQLLSGSPTSQLVKQA